MQYQELPVPTDLQTHLLAVWVVEGAVGELIRVTPDGCTDLIAHDARATKVRFVGPMTRARVVALRCERSVGVQLRPGTLATVRSGLRLRDVRDLEIEIVGLRGSVDPIDGILDLVRTMVSDKSIMRHPDVDRVLDAMAVGAGPLDALYRRLGLRERTVQRLFDRFVGLTPRQTASVLRQRQATRVLRAGQGDLADLASELGYADQAHLTRDYRAQVGLPSGRYREEIRGVGFVQDAAASRRRD